MGNMKIGSMEYDRVKVAQQKIMEAIDLLSIEAETVEGWFSISGNAVQGLGSIAKDLSMHGLD